MIIATAGHVDHGKTLLVRALTGVDTDRLPEEKRRGMTIDLGFAYLPLAATAAPASPAASHISSPQAGRASSPAADPVASPAADPVASPAADPVASPAADPVASPAATSIGFIDVPGHERFVHNMLCGVTGIDFVLFIVAADDGPMPQSREHLAILDLLQLRAGAIALTKIDRVDAGRLAEVKREIAALFSPTTLARAPLFAVSAVTGAGIAALQAHLTAAAAALPPRRVTGNFRLPIDRCFTLPGAGLVVTGTAVSGSVATGEQVRVQRSGMKVRVRTIHAQNTASAGGRAGQRCALNLAGSELRSERIARGDWIVAGEVPPAVRKIDARLRILASEKRPFSHWTPVHVHLGASDVTGRVALLEEAFIAPGDCARVQLVLDHAVGALHGDRFIVRDQSATRTLGGGQTIDIFPPARGRARPERLACLAALEYADHATALRALLPLSPGGVNTSQFAAGRNLAADELALLLAALNLKTVAAAAGAMAYTAARWDALRATVLAELAAWHRRSPDGAGPAEDRLLRAAGLRLPREVVAGVVSELAREGRVNRDGSGIRLSSHRPQLADADAAVWRRIEPLLQAGGLRPPSVAEIAAALGEEAKKTEAMLARAARHGLVIQVSKTRFYLPAPLRRLAALMEELAAGSTSAESGNTPAGARTTPAGAAITPAGASITPAGAAITPAGAAITPAGAAGVSAAAFRDRSGIGRNLTIELLEYFDRVKFTRRTGDRRTVLRPAADLWAGQVDSAPPPGL